MWLTGHENPKTNWLSLLTWSGIKTAQFLCAARPVHPDLSERSWKGWRSQQEVAKHLTAGPDGLSAVFVVTTDLRCVTVGVCESLHYRLRNTPQHVLAILIIIKIFVKCKIFFIDYSKCIHTHTCTHTHTRTHTCTHTHTHTHTGTHTHKHSDYTKLNSHSLKLPHAEERH